MSPSIVRSAVPFLLIYNSGLRFLLPFVFCLLEAGGERTNGFQLILSLSTCVIFFLSVVEVACSDAHNQPCRSSTGQHQSSDHHKSKWFLTSREKGSVFVRLDDHLLIHLQFGTIYDDYVYIVFMFISSAEPDVKRSCRYL